MPYPKAAPAEGSCETSQNNANDIENGRMELMDLSWLRLVLDGPPAGGMLTLLALPFLGIPLLVVTLIAWGLDAISARKGIALIAGFLVLWFATLQIVGRIG